MTRDVGEEDVVDGDEVIVRDRACGYGESVPGVAGWLGIDDDKGNGKGNETTYTS